MAPDGDLLGRWRGTLPGGDPTTVESTGRDLLRRWDEPHRRYHTRRHLADVLDRVAAHRRYAEDLAAVQLAAWYHDAVYDPTRPDNEERSAVLAEQTLPRLVVPASRASQVARLVRLTAGHAPEPGDRDGVLLCDADLAILAAPPDRYDAYGRAVREEYSHLPDDVFRAGRATVLRDLLRSPTLYRIPELRATWEQRARANLARELSTMDT